ncbi:MAG: hypothetical protein AB4080_12420 [Trichodesmium sp.]
MPEAELPGNQHLPENNDPVNYQKLDKNSNDHYVDKIRPHLASESHQSSEDNDWETVNFPNAISVDSIPVVEMDSSEAKDLTAQPQFLRKSQEVPTEKSSESVESVSLMEELHQCNYELVNRVAELETALEECQSVLENQERILEERTQELAKTQQQVTRLFYKLELCNQVIQRQEILVESLTDKWEEGQQQQAQMERECALTKQSYTQQSYYLKELENNCRELRARLNRQQQQTLQFKAALERCLEMPGKMAMDMEYEPQETLTKASPIQASQVNSTPEVPKQEHPFVGANTKILPLIHSEPVKPWTPPQKNQKKAESLIPKKEKIVTQTSLNEGDKLDLPQPIKAQQKVSGEAENTSEDNLFAEVNDSKLNPSLPSFQRIAEVIDYELEEVSQKDILEETEASEYVILDKDLVPEESQSEELEMFPENNVIVESEKANILEEKTQTEIQRERISWNISTGKWNVFEYQPELEKDTETEIKAEDSPEVLEEEKQDAEQITKSSQVNSKLDLPTMKPLVFEPESLEEEEEEVLLEAPKKQYVSLSAIDLPSFPRIAIEEQPSAVNG